MATSATSTTEPAQGDRRVERRRAAHSSTVRDAGWFLHPLVDCRGTAAVLAWAWLACVAPGAPGSFAAEAAPVAPLGDGDPAVAPLEMDDLLAKDHGPLSSFGRRLPLKPPDLCHRFADFGVTLSEWRPSEINRGEYECHSEMTPFPTEAADGAEANAFFTIRGRSEDRSDSLRARINAPDRDTAYAALPFVLGAIGKFYAGLTWPLPRATVAALERFERVRDAKAGLRTALDERGGFRFDLVVFLPETSDILPAGTLMPPGR